MNDPFGEGTNNDMVESEAADDENKSDNFDKLKLFRNPWFFR